MKRQLKAKTAYELLERVCAHILEEPKRYYQGSWVIRGKEVIREQFPEFKGQAPACGTTACRAGWIVGLNDGLNALGNSHGVPERANNILGMSPDDTAALFDYNAVSGTPGTKSYVAQGVAGVRAFMKQHKAHLQARKLCGV